MWQQRTTGSNAATFSYQLVDANTEVRRVALSNSGIHYACHCDYEFSSAGTLWQVLYQRLAHIG